MLGAMNCVSCGYENRTEKAVRGRPACLLCVERAALRGSGSHGLPWYVRVFGRAVIGSGCWEYPRDTSGHACPIMVDGRLVRPHGLVMEDISSRNGHVVDRTCRNHSCVNPKHLRWLTHREKCRNRAKPSLTAEEKRLKHNAYHRAYRTRNRESINAARRNSGQKLP